MNITGISSSIRISSATDTVPTVAPIARDPLAPLVEIDSKTRQPVPLRFPWLSRLSTELEKASGQPAPFGKSPELGEKLDAKV